jgi:sterol desaturase/sphingolipid hydroxylase (fatty acid hydroxylase superfamily)
VNIFAAGVVSQSREGRVNPLAAAVAELRRLYPAAPNHQPWLKSLAGLIIGTFVLAVFFWLVESIWPEDHSQPKWRLESRLDLFYWFFDSLVARVAMVGAATVAIVLLLLRVPHHPTLVTAQPLWLQAIETLVLGDLLGYWIHRAMHSVPWLWRIHAIHHSSEQLDWLAAARVHPLETLIHRSLNVAPFFVLGFSPAVLSFHGPFLALYPIFLHSNIRFGYGRLRHWIASPAFHRWHHSADAVAINRNFAALLPLWDHLFGTLWLPEKARPERYCIAGERIEPSVRVQLMYPWHGHLRHAPRTGKT